MTLATKPTYFVAATACFVSVAHPSHWVKVNATTIDGAKRLAMKQAHGTTFTVHVATKNHQGEFKTIASMDDSCAITRRRATWRSHMPRLKPISFSGGVKSISDDDLCADCQHCQFKPGDMSACALKWPGLEDANGYVQECTEFTATS